MHARWHAIAIRKSAGAGKRLFGIPISPEWIDKYGLPVAYLLFTVALFMWLLRAAQARADRAEQRNEALQQQILQLATAQTEASLRTAAALDKK